MLFGILDINRQEMHHNRMRTTLTLDDDVFELASQQSKLRGVSLGRTVSDLIRRGMVAGTPTEKSNGVLVFCLPKDSPTVTTADVLRIESDGV